MTRQKNQNGHSSKELWIDYEPQGQPRWDGHGFIHDPAESHDSANRESGYSSGHESVIDIKEVVERIGEWVLQQKNEMWTVVWYQSLRREILTGEKASEKSVIYLARLYTHGEYYRILKGPNKGMLRPVWERWYDNFRQAEHRLKEKLQPVLRKLLGA